MRYFVVFASYFRCFIEGFAKLAAPLHSWLPNGMTRNSLKPSGKSLPAAWMEEYEQSVEGLKSRLMSAPVLAYANFSLHFILKVSHKNKMAESDL